MFGEEFEDILVMMSDKENDNSIKNLKSCSKEEMVKLVSWVKSAEQKFVGKPGFNAKNTNI